MMIAGCVYMVIYHNDHRSDWRVVDQFVATTPEAAKDFAEARKPEGYHVDDIFQDTDGPMMLVTEHE